jgi:hypothetical protein
MSRFPDSRVLLRLRNTLGSLPHVSLPSENPLDRKWVALPRETHLYRNLSYLTYVTHLIGIVWHSLARTHLYSILPYFDISNPLDRNWVALPCENPLVQYPPLVEICNPVSFRQSGMQKSITRT